MSVDLSRVPPTVGPRFTRHDGSAAGPDDDFMVLADPSIGEVVSAGTNRTLRGYHNVPQSMKSTRVALAFLGLIFGALAGFGITKAALTFLLDLLDVELDS